MSYAVSFVPLQPAPRRPGRLVRARAASLALVAMLSWLPGRALATPASPEPPPPSQEVATDPDVPVYVLSLTADALQAVLGRYLVRLDYAPGDHHVLFLRSGWDRASARSAVLLEVGYALAPQGLGVEGLQLGLAAGVLLDAEGPRAVRTGGELAYQHVWGSVALGVGAGVDRQLGLRQGIADRWVPRMRLFLGWAWR